MRAGPTRRRATAIATAASEAPYNVYPTSDGWIAIICVGDPYWRNLCAAMGNPDAAADPRFASLKDRVASMDAVDEIVSDRTRRQIKQGAFEILMQQHVSCAPVRDLTEVMNDPNMHARGSLQWQDHPELGRIVVPHSPLRFAGLPLTALIPSRKLGENTQAVLAERLGWSEDELSKVTG